MSNKEKVILVAHGSRKKEANEEILTLSKKLNAKMAKQGVVVCAAFLEMAKPSIEDEVKQAAKEGFNLISLWPYLLSSGSHLQKDMPFMVEKLSRLNPNLRFRLLPPLFKTADWIDILAKALKKAF